MKLLSLALILSPDVKVGICALVVALFMFGWSWIMYDKGRRDERFRQTYLCLDCGNLRDKSDDTLCRDCRRELWGEMAQ